MTDFAALLGGRADFFPATFPSISEHLAGEVRRIAGASHVWPVSGPKTVQMHYAVMLEPSGEPFWALNSRFYWVFELGWPTNPAIWINYRPLTRRDGHVVGDPTFPNVNEPSSYVIGALGTSNIIQTHVPGELVAAFDASVSEQEVQQLVQDSIRGRIVRVVSQPGNAYLVSCRPFAAPEDAALLQKVPKVRYAECNWHVSLIAPGARWRSQRLT